MSLEDALAKELKDKGAKCLLGKIYDKLDEEDRVILRAAIFSDKITNVALSNALKALGHTASDMTIGRHKNGKCPCPYSPEFEADDVTR